MKTFILMKKNGIFIILFFVSFFFITLHSYKEVAGLFKTSEKNAILSEFFIYYVIISIIWRKIIDTLIYRVSIKMIRLKKMRNLKTREENENEAIKLEKEINILGEYLRVLRS